MVDKKRIMRRQVERKEATMSQEDYIAIKREMGKFATKQFFNSYTNVIAFHKANADERADYLASFNGEFEEIKAAWAPLSLVVDRWELIDFKLVYKVLHIHESEALYEQYREMSEALGELIVDFITQIIAKTHQDHIKSLPPEDRRGYYQHYLSTSQWQRTRRTMLKRAKHKCQVCSSTIRLEVHHNTYARMTAELPGDLIVLCHDCHEIFHKNGKLAKTEDI